MDIEIPIHRYEQLAYVKFCQLGMWHGKMNKTIVDLESRMPDEDGWTDDLSLAQMKKCLKSAQKRISNDAKKIAKDVEIHQQFVEAIGFVP